ncbi:MAG: hypothetical protein GX998_04450, partial [Firmicutes bacterium]|nr:hypothetical protein [Bacillota bacterium]
MDAQPQFLRDDEIDLREVFMVLWNGKWTIIALMVVAALVAGVGGRIFLTPSYDAVATLLIMPPTYQSAIEPEPLPLDTYRALAMTHSIASQVIESLQLKNAKNESLTADGVLKAVEVETSVPQGSRTDSRETAGMMNIKVSWNDPTIAKDIANTWADVFMKNTAHIRKSESDEIAGVILSQFGSTEEALKNAERQLLEFRTAGSIPMMTQQVELLMFQLGQRRERVLRMQTDLEMKRHQFETLSKQLAALEEDGEWLGLLTRDPSKLSDNGHPARRQIVETMEQLLAANAALIEFDERAKISLLEQELELEQERLLTYQSELAALEAQYPQLEAQFAALFSTLQNQEKTLVMSRSLSIDAMWSAVSDDQELLDKLKELRLMDESPNPTYQQVEMLLADSQVELAALPRKIQAYEELVGSCTERIAYLESTLPKLQQTRQALEAPVTLSNELYDSMKEQYASMRKEWAELASEVPMLKAELQLAEGELTQYEENVLAIQGALLDLQLEEERLVRSIDALTRTHDSLSEQAESARLAELQATGDVRFISPAVAPRSPSSPNHKLNIAIAIVLAGM